MGPLERQRSEPDTARMGGMGGMNCLELEVMMLLFYGAYTPPPSSDFVGTKVGRVTVLRNKRGQVRACLFIRQVSRLVRQESFTYYLVGGLYVVLVPEDDNKECIWLRRILKE